MGLRISVARCADMPDCTRNGISARFDQLTIVNIKGPVEFSDNAPAVWLVEHPTVKGIVFLTPNDPAKGLPSGMFGGNFGYTSDSRMGAAIRAITGHEWHGAVKIHDRYE